MSVETKPAPVVVQKTIEDRLWGLLPIAFMLLLMVAVNRGWLTPEQADTVQKAVPVFMTKAPESESTTTTTVTIDESGPVASVAVPSTAVSPQDVQRWIDIFRPLIVEIIESIPKPPIEVPPVVVTPPVNPPVEPPVPPVVSGSLQLALTDAAGLAVASSSVPPGALLKVSLKGCKGPKVEWTKRTIGRVQFTDFENQEKAIVLDPGAELDLFVTDYGWQQQVSLRVVASTTGQPPPVNPPVVVTPPVVPPVEPPIQPGTKTFDVYVVEDGTIVRPVATAAILNNLRNHELLKSKGHKFAGQIAGDGSGAAEHVKAQGTSLPALAVFDRESLQWVKSVPLPSDLGVSLLAGIGG